jgi:hypothetical protein
MLLKLAIVFEIILSSNPEYLNNWEAYGLASEVRAMLWLFTAFQLSGRLSLLLRSTLLYFSIFQIWTTVTYSFQIFGLLLDLGVWKEVAAIYLGVVWFIFRSYDAHPGSIPGKELAKGANGDVFILVKRPNIRNPADVLIAMLGLPVRTISLYAGDFVYGMDMEPGCFVKRHISKVKGMSNRYAVRLNLSVPIASHVIDMARGMVGLRFSWINNNCTSSLLPVWKVAGLRMPRVCYYAPGLFMLGLRLKGGRVD